PSSANTVTIEKNSGLTINVHDAASVASLTVTNYVLNDGTITLTCSNSGGTAGLTASGVLGIRNSGTGTINVTNGNCGGSTRGITGNITNDGTITVGFTTVFGGTAGLGATITNNGTFSIAAGPVVTFAGTPLTWIQNGGSLNIGSPNGFTFAGTFQYNAGP